MPACHKLNVGGHFYRTEKPKTKMLRLLINLTILFIQCSVTFVMLLFIYMIFVLLDYQGGIDGFIGTTIFQPILGGLISIVTILVCLIIGLPIRLVKTINSWCSKNYFIFILGTITGLTLLAVSFLPSFKESVKTTIENQETTKEIPNLILVSIGWFLTAFATLQIFPTERIKLWTENTITNITGYGRK